MEKPKTPMKQYRENLKKIDKADSPRLCFGQFSVTFWRNREKVEEKVDGGEEVCDSFRTELGSNHPPSNPLTYAQKPISFIQFR
ncbi:hypothetical protein U1Q18_008948 [Sarracenia purpurea var. burkii]